MTGSLSISAVGLSKRYRSSAGEGGWLDALKDVSFDIHPGEAVGLIGRNGAGKSTLLRILSRVTRPTRGYADVYGRIGALLVVGTGFHPDLTGRENTYLSGAILGLSREDVGLRFDEIVAFSEIETFIDTPVKRYSSGMYARLGFAVAAHLLPDILIVDEVLAVGDLPFQAKCLARMRRLTQDGTTVLFVSHNLLAVGDLCERGLVVDHGRLTFDGEAGEAINRYRGSLGASATTSRTERTFGGSELRVRIDGIRPAEMIGTTPNAAMRVEVDVNRGDEASESNAILDFVVERSDGTKAVHLRSDLAGTRLVLGPGTTTLSLQIDDLALAPGSYALWLRVSTLESDRPIIVDSDRMNLHVVGDQRRDGLVLPRHRFTQGSNDPVDTAERVLR